MSLYDRLMRLCKIKKMITLKANVVKTIPLKKLFTGSSANKIIWYKSINWNLATFDIKLMKLFTVRELNNIYISFITI